MLNKLAEFMRRYHMVQPGDTVVCAVSGGADSMALLWAMYLLRSKLDIRLQAAHVNHGLRGAESDRDEAFVRDFCQGHEIPFVSTRIAVTPGKKGLEAAAREERYGFLRTLPGKIATAHTANDNAETVLMHLVRGTGLKGLGGISPVNGNLIRPMLSVTRQEVLAFLNEYAIDYVTDSSNETDVFLRNRLRHHVMPLLQQENPRLAENLSAMALGLREDEAALTAARHMDDQLSVSGVRQMLPAQRYRTISAFLMACGVKEPEREHILLTENLIFSDNPSASANMPGGVRIGRKYDRLERCGQEQEIVLQNLPCPGAVQLPNMRVICTKGTEAAEKTVVPVGSMVVRSRQTGDTMRLPGGTKALKKLFIDHKIPARQRMQIPVVADEQGVLWVYGFGPNLDRLGLDGVQIRFEQVRPSGML